MILNSHSNQWYRVITTETLLLLIIRDFILFIIYLLIKYRVNNNY
jgi:hypothetical protein